MTQSLHLALPYIAAAQAQKHVTHNEALRILDAIVMLAVDDRDLSIPPGAPVEGARYLVKPTGGGAFAGKDNQIAHFRDGAFAFHAPQPGWIAYVIDEGVMLVFDGNSWMPFIGAAPQLQNVSRLGLAATADAVNPLSARLNNALFVAKSATDGGDGDLRYKLSKEAAANTLSFLFQNNFSGRAEIGLTGDDDFHFKVSGDGSTWRDGIVIASNTGKVSFPQGAAGLREKLTAARTYYVRPNGHDANDGLANTAGGAFLTIQKAVNVVFGTLDLGGNNVTIQLAEGTYNAGVLQSSPQVGAGLITIEGNASAPANVVVQSSSGFYAVAVENGAALRVKDFEVQSATSGGLKASTGASLQFSNMRIGACAQHQIRADDLGRVTCLEHYAIVGNGMSHWCSVGGGLIRCQNRTITLTGTPTFPAGFVNNQICGMSIVNGNTFSGGATGPRHSIDTNSVVFVGGAGASYLPGNAIGTITTGAQYA
jgi:hypothetical protein